jgi:hypothetical protein
MTRQIQDVLLYEGQRYGLNTEILEPYFDKHPERRIGSPGGFSALWRGYVANFAIQDGLFIIEHFGPTETPWKLIR